MCQDCPGSSGTASLTGRVRLYVAFREVGWELPKVTPPGGAGSRNHDVRIERELTVPEVGMLCLLRHRRLFKMVPVRDSNNTGGEGKDFEQSGLVGPVFPWKS